MWLDVSGGGLECLEVADCPRKIGLKTCLAFCLIFLFPDISVR